jgi:hypothetical protein
MTIPTPNVSMRPGENLHQATKGMPPMENGLVCEGINEPPNSQCCNLLSPSLGITEEIMS